MKNFNIKCGVLALALSLGVLTSCEQENEELLNEPLSSVKELAEDVISEKGVCDPNDWEIIDAISGTDYNGHITTKIDDRSCSYDYKQSNYGGAKKWGGYRLNSANNLGGLQVRMERTSARQNFSSGKYIQLKSTVRILNAGLVNDNIADNSVNDGDGTYIAQVKGRHTGGGGSSDPAIMLLLAKPKRSNSGKGGVIRDSNGKVKDYKIYAEVVTKRGGSGSSGRKLVYITTVKRSQAFGITLRSEFYISEGRKRQRVKYTVNGVQKTLFVSVKSINGADADPIEHRIRMGAYRCKGGKAEILFQDNLRFTKN